MNTDVLKSKIDAGCKLYLQPVGLGVEGERLAGGWRHFLGIRLTTRTQSGDVESSLYNLSEFDQFLKLPEVAALYENLTAKRSVFGRLSMDKPHLMAILNVTPDSFSDGGDNYQSHKAIEQALQMDKDGASILDIGGESTRPGAEDVSVEVEVRRVEPVISSLQGKVKASISIDTRNPETMAKAVAAGADFINDVTALEHSERSMSAAVRAQKPLFLMHMKGQPKTMQASPFYSHVVLDVYDYLESRLLACEAKGLSRNNIATDVGIGFGKTLQHNTDLLANLGLFHALGAPILLGASRKSFIDKVVGSTQPKHRLPGSLAALLTGLDQGVQMTRVHDVADSNQAMKVWQEINGKK